MKDVRVGEAPEHIKAAWKGLVLPCWPILGYPTGGYELGVMSGKQQERNRFGFSVPQQEALETLAKSAPEAAQWWRDHGFPKPGTCFCFGENEAEIVSGVTRQQIVHVTGEMQGDPYR